MAPNVRRAKKTILTHNQEERQRESLPEELSQNQAEKEGGPWSQKIHLWMKPTSEVRYLRGRKQAKGIVKLDLLLQISTVYTFTVYRFAA